MEERTYYCASISGGKDSICMGLMLLDKGYPVDDFIFFDMGVEYPETYEAIAKFEADTGRKVSRVTPPDGDFWYYACEREYIARGKLKGIPQKGYGFPGFNVRWCTRLKIDAIKRHYEKNGYKKVIEYIGIAKDEPKRIHTDDPSKRYPLVEFGMTEADALKYCRDRGYFAPPHAYDYNNRVSCFCCPYSKQRQVEYLIEHRPELWQIIKDHERPEKTRYQWKFKGTAYFEEQLRRKRAAEKAQQTFNF